MLANQLRARVVDLRRESGRALVKSGMWMIVGYTGASVSALGLAWLFDGYANPLAALALVLAGGALALYGWRSGYRVLDRIDAPVTPVAGQARAAASRSASGLTTLIGAPEA